MTVQCAAESAFVSLHLLRLCALHMERSERLNEPWPRAAGERRFSASSFGLIRNDNVSRVNLWMERIDMVWQLTLDSWI